MINLNKGNKNIEKKEISSTGLTEEQLVIQKLKLELEIKQLELKKLELENSGIDKAKKSEDSTKTEMVSEANEVNEDEKSRESLEDTKTSMNLNSEKDYEKLINLRKYSAKAYEEKRLKNLKRKKRAIIVSVIIFVYLCINGINNQIYYSSIEQIFNPEDYYMLTYQDIYDMYGEPKGVDYESEKYDFGEYSLHFSYEHGYVGNVSYIPNEKFVYKNSPKDAFRLFGLENELGMFEQDEFEKEIFRAKSDFYVSAVILNSELCEEKTTNYVTVYFKENYPDREVFEGDFTDIPVVYDLVQYLGEDREYVYNSLGGNITKYDEDLWYIYSDLGKIEIYFYYDKVYSVEFILKKPMRYKFNTQEVLVMFGVNPGEENIYLDDYNYYYGEERYLNFKGKESRFDILGLDIDNKTFNHVYIFADERNKIN